MNAGDLVRYTGPQLLGKPFTGRITRLPKPHVPGKPRRIDDDRVFVQVGTEKRPRPVRPEHLEVIG